MLALGWFDGLTWLCAAHSLCSEHDVDYSLGMHHESYLYQTLQKQILLPLPHKRAPNSGSGFPPAVLITRIVPRHDFSIQGKD